jgi:hypothetical protein
VQCFKIFFVLFFALKTVEEQTGLYMPKELLEALMTVGGQTS